MPVAQSSTWETKLRSDVRLSTLCTGEISTNDPDQTLSCHRKLLAAVEEAAGTHGVNEISFQLDDCGHIDPGGILLLYNAGANVCPSQSLKAFISRSGPSATYEMVADNLHHLEDSLAGKKRQKGDNNRQYLLRSIPEPDKMVGEIADWASTLEGFANAKAEDVACWQMQIAEVATNTFQHSRAKGIFVVGNAL